MERSIDPYLTDKLMNLPIIVERIIKYIDYNKDKN